MKDVVKLREPQTHPCEECGKSISKKRSLRRHQQIHRGAEELFPCGAFWPPTRASTGGRDPSSAGPAGAASPWVLSWALRASESLSSRICLSIHSRPHSEGSPSAECGRSVVKQGSLTAHTEVHRPFQCPQCSSSFGHRDVLVAHQRLHLRGGPFVCTECGKGFSTMRGFSVHQRNHAKQKGRGNSVVQIKEEPDFGFRSEESVLENMAREGDVAQRCSRTRNPSDPKNPPWKIRVREEPEPPSAGTASTAAAACQKLHIKKEPPENPAYGKVFDPKIPLLVLQGKQPKKEEDADGQQEQEIPIASNQVLHVKEEPEESTDFGMCYGQKPNLSAIQRIQIKEEPGVEANHQQSQSPKSKQEKCCQSPKEAMPKNRKKSMSRKDPPAKADPRGERTFPCPECGKSFKQKSNLTRHRKIHASEGPYKCGDCGESFRMNRKLRRHRRARLGEPFPCPECGRSFTQRSSLLRHQSIHTKEEPYQCPECEKTFNQKANLFRHQTIHARVGPCKCTKCGKRFPHQRLLVKHQLLHSRGGAHECGACGKRYRLKKYLRRHQKIHTREGASPCSKPGESARTGRRQAEQRALGPVRSEGES